MSPIPAAPPSAPETGGTAIPPLVCFSHGKESGPWGIKITRLAEVARARGYAVMSPDYTHSFDPHERVRQLLEIAPRGRPLVLVGSSMGGYVAAQACAALAADALFLMAPALYFPGYDEEPRGVPRHCLVLHGIDDDIVPMAAAERFAASHGARLERLPAGHSLNECLHTVAEHFAGFLDALPQPRRRPAAAGRAASDPGSRR